MKKQILTVIVSILALTMVGCADYGQYADGQSKVSEANAKLVAGYFGATAARDGQIFQALAGKGDSSAAVLYAVLQGQKDAEVLKAFKVDALKAPTTGMDVMNTFMGSTLPTVARWGFGYMIGSELVDALSTGMNIGGDYVQMNNTANAGRDLDFSSSFDYSKSTSTWDAGDDIITDSMNTTN